MTMTMDEVAGRKVAEWIKSFAPAGGCAACDVPAPPAPPKLDVYVADGSGMYGATDRPTPGIDILVDVPEETR